MSDELRHYGVKGMKWGVRRYEDARAKRHAPTAVATRQNPGDYVQSKGGRNQAASADAVATQVFRQKAKASTTDSLSNQELQQLVQRMNLEQQYSTLKRQQDRRSRGVRTVNAILTAALPMAVGNYAPAGTTIKDVTMNALNDHMPATSVSIGKAFDLAAEATSGPKIKK